MLELEENARLLQALKNKITELGESLWSNQIRNSIKRVRKSNYARKFLEWQ